MENQLGFKRLSTGDMLRSHLARGTQLGLEAKAYMDRGELVPDEIILGMVAQELGGADRLILDGFPRTMAQAEALDAMLRQAGQTLDAALLLEVPEEVLVQRLTSRRVCRSCGAVYNLITMPPKKAGVCDVCGGQLYQRDDDTEETVRRRIEVYRSSTEPLIEYYRNKGLLRVVDGNASPDAVFDRVKEVLGL